MADKYEEGEKVIKLKFDISGGLGKQKEGTVLRHLSESAFIGLRAAGHEVLNGPKTSEPVDPAAANKAPPAPTGQK